MTKLPALMAATGVLLLAGCGNDRPSASVGEIVQHLGQEPALSTVKRVLPAKQYDQAVRCVADYLHDKGIGSDVDDWIAGKRTIEKVRGTDSRADARAAFAGCLNTAMQRR